MIFDYMFNPATVETRVNKLKQYDPQANYVQIYTDIHKTMQDMVNSAYKWVEYDPVVMHRYAKEVEDALKEFAKRQDPTFKAGPPFAELMNQIEIQLNEYTSGGDASASFCDRACLY